MTPAQLQLTPIDALLPEGLGKQQRWALMRALGLVGVFTAADALAMGRQRIQDASYLDRTIPPADHLAEPRMDRFEGYLRAVTGLPLPFPRATDLSLYYDDIRYGTPALALPYREFKYYGSLGFIDNETIGALIDAPEGELPDRSDVLGRDMIDFVRVHIVGRLVEPFDRAKAAKNARG